MKQRVIDKLKEFTKHKNILLTNRGNQSIFLSLYLIKKLTNKNNILIPDQGGWFTFRTYPKILGFNIQEVKTNNGIIDLRDLKEKSNNSAALLFTSFAGYFAEQPLEEISEICKQNNCLLIEDASGSITDNILCNGKYSDIIIGSFGDWKVINLGYGGFISANHNLEEIKDLSNIIRLPVNIYKDLYQLLNKERLTRLLKKHNEVKEELVEFKIFHNDKRGLNVVTEYNHKILDYCKKNNYQYLICPKYIRINKKAVSIELKRL